MTEHLRAHPDLTHATLSIFFLTLLVAASFWVLSPFLTAILWATIICVSVWPLLLRLEARLGGARRLAVTIVVAGILLGVFIPVTLAVLTIVANAQDITAQIRSFQSITLPAVPAWVAGLPVVGERAAAGWTRFAALDPQARSEALAPYAQRALQWFLSQAGSIGALLVQFLLTTIISAIMLANGEFAREGILRFAERLGGQHGRDTAILAAKAIRGVVLGVVGTAMIQAAVGGIGLVIAGVPAAGFLTALMLFLCLAQLGPLLVLVPVVVWLFWSGYSGLGWVLAVIALVAGLLDGIVRPILIKRGANLPLLLIFGGVIGGLIAFGIIGLFIGPVVLSVAYTLLTTWVSLRPPVNSAEA